ncbi:MAG: nitrous oxide-stimulated promoter family protein [Prevotellaceae bacterium]|nr:nitrous oxide-stimulated promoter family protein [Prevotellaceae bacterium]
MTRIEQEKKTVRQMVEIYCRGKKHMSKEGRRTRQSQLCEECSALLDYAYQRLDHCKFGDKKPTCKKCPIHCYKPAMKKQMREVMRYAGPRMMWHHPIAAIKHLIREIP